MNDIPAHLQDQLQAAVSDTERTFALTIVEMVLAGRLDGNPNPIPQEKIRGWLEECTTCGHLINPQPVYVIMALREMVCGNCLSDAVARLQANQDQNCDVCHAYRADNIFSEFTVRSGPVLIFGNRGLCCQDLRT